MNDHELRAQYLAGTQRPAPAAPDGHLPSADAIFGLVSGEGSEAQRLKLLDIIMSDPDLRREYAILYSAQSGVGAAPVARRWSRPVRLALAAGIGIVVVGAGFMLRGRTAQTSLVRGDSAGITLVTPDANTSPAGGILAWKSDAASDDYVVELLSAGGDSVAAVVTRDTTLALAGTAGAEAAAAWRVIGRRSDGTTVTSPIRQLTAGAR
jgi:hypothetical protein